MADFWGILEGFEIEEEAKLGKCEDLERVLEVFD
jgi:hypothetical protein